MIKLNIRLKTNSEVSKYQQIADQIAALIASGTIKEGEMLPGDRALAAQLGVSRNTVRDAYQVLKDRKLVTAAHARGTFVGKKAPAKKNSVSQKAGSSSKTSAATKKSSLSTTKQSAQSSTTSQPPSKPKTTTKSANRKKASGKR